MNLPLYCCYARLSFLIKLSFIPQPLKQRAPVLWMPQVHCESRSGIFGSHSLLSNPSLVYKLFSYIFMDCQVLFMAFQKQSWEVPWQLLDWKSLLGRFWKTKKKARWWFLGIQQGKVEMEQKVRSLHLLQDIWIQFFWFCRQKWNVSCPTGQLLMVHLKWVGNI